MKKLIRSIPILGPFLRRLYRSTFKPRSSFKNSAEYWNTRYQQGGNSGSGSYSHLAEFKAEILNRYVEEQGIRTVIEFGCGDGNQLSLARYPDYVGYDVSPHVIERCRDLFRDEPGRAFHVMGEYDDRQADLALSLDVIFHLVEDSVYEEYMSCLFSASRKHIIIYSSNTDDNSDLPEPHFRHRRFTTWIEKKRPDWRLCEHIPNRYPFEGDPDTGSFADFYIFRLEAGKHGA